MALVTRAVHALVRLDDRVLYRGKRDAATEHRQRAVVGACGLFGSIGAILMAAANYPDVFAGFGLAVLGGVWLGASVALLAWHGRIKLRDEE
jgi:hypothetical protein